MNTETGMRSGLITALRYMLRPIITFCLKRSITIQEVLESVKAVYVSVAVEQLEKQSEKVNASRLCVATGLHRMEVLRLWKDGPKEPCHHYITRVIGQWLSDRAYTTKSGQPRVLTFGDEDSEFNKLTLKVCKDVHPGTVLFELKRVGAVEEARGGIKLIVTAYDPKVDPEEGFALFATDGSHLLECVEENVFSGKRTPNLHIRTEYDNIEKDALPKIREWFFDKGNAFHEQARKFLAKYDLDLNRKKKAKGGGKVVLTSFSRLEGEEKKQAK